MSKVSIAIETTCREGGLVMAIDGELKSVVQFNAAMRHASQLVARLREMLAEYNLGPRDVNEVYVSAGPGSFTGVRLGMTVARTMGASIPGLKFVSVPTVRAIAQSQADTDAREIAVVLDGKDEQVYAARFINNKGLLESEGQDGITNADDFFKSLPPNTTVIGEAIGYCSPSRNDIKLVDGTESYPKAENVWKVGSQLSAEEKFTELSHLLPVYARKPEAVRLWEKRNGENG